MPDKYTLQTEKANSDFATQAARDAFGKHYVRPRDRAFVDHEPWQKLGDVTDGVVDHLRRDRRDSGRKRVAAPQ